MPRCATIMPTSRARQLAHRGPQHWRGAAGGPHALPQVGGHRGDDPERQQQARGSTSGRCGRPSQPAPATRSDRSHRRGPAQARARSGSSACFQRASGPTPIRNTSGAISGTNTVSKYGGPTEILPMPSASSNSGYSVPSSTAAIGDEQQHVVGQQQRFARHQREARAQADLRRAPGKQQQRAADHHRQEAEDEQAARAGRWRRRAPTTARPSAPGRCPAATARRP